MDYKYEEIDKDGLHIQIKPVYDWTMELQKWLELVENSDSADENYTLLTC